ncbi:hypothetical protein F5984_23855 [Rudanella paleaurantiibacter]|uniref:Uncharacterized protein n=1 Tax=Rudanella paleaurantiibacter TaxID=2614655 RepID=A0A7J5TSU7_9BACT|nr:hypothetical protein [Rudanella paleaurantiibacter]KAB7726666.1 hypothetical protein F5984_23855 [Rudanella paleaurantiibacter]
MATGKGGRKEKSEEQQLTQVVKTTLTKTDLEGLQRAYKQQTTGQKISFAEYIRQQLLAKSDPKSGNEERSKLLSIQLELAEIGSQLGQILGKIRQQEGLTLPESDPDGGSETDSEKEQLQLRLAQNLDCVEATIKQISQWLYDCSPEKI